ncbi:TMV resistance protein N-like isoform X2 [Mangifera indica]|uniref:TMV resistance protein N-like isoform X2 n=1 Tax=Mangifera indica TaxID=29780 RepID=UPI001CF96052|nr:TMV resistance protein N-like isoform X2 [Mangifera indica]
MSSQRFSSSSSSSSSGGWKYDVFLNFEGEDTGKNFADHLYVALNEEGFKVFKGDREMERGTPIPPEAVRKAIAESRISIVVFSKSYASSTSCLDELAWIVQCKNTMEQTIIPIFYGVEPRVPRHQNRDFREAFDEHEETFKQNMEIVEMWRESLTEVANLSGYHLKDRYEADLIKDVVKQVKRKLSVSASRLTNLRKVMVGVSSCLEQLRIQAAEMIPAPRFQRGQTLIAPLVFFFSLGGWYL